MNRKSWSQSYERLVQAGGIKQPRLQVQEVSKMKDKCLHSSISAWNIKKQCLEEDRYWFPLDMQCHTMTMVFWALRWILYAEMLSCVLSLSNLWKRCWDWGVTRIIILIMMNHVFSPLALVGSGLHAFKKQHPINIEIVVAHMEDLQRAYASSIWLWLAHYCQ